MGIDAGSEPLVTDALSKALWARVGAKVVDNNDLGSDNAREAFSMEVTNLMVVVRNPDANADKKLERGPKKTVQLPC